MNMKLWPTFGARKDPAFKEKFGEFTKSLTLIVDIEQLKDNVISNLREIVHIEPILIFLLDQDLNRFQIAESRGLEAKDKHEMYFAADGPLVRWFTVNETHLFLPENPSVISYFSEQEQEFLKKMQTTLIFPLLAMNRVTGLVCLGEKIDSKTITAGEIELLVSLIGQAAFAFENAYLYQQQKTRLRKMYRADRLATIGQLAAGAAHEIRNPLTSIRSTIQYLEKSLADDSQKELVGDLIEEVDRINGIIEGMLSFSRPSTPVTEKVDLKALIEQILHLVATTADKQKIGITHDFLSESTMLDADASQLKQVFLNIIMNAIQAMEDGGELRISVEHSPATQHQSLKKGSFRIQFRDTGAGIPAEDLEHIFDPFFTTKHDGTGLGLSISYGIIRQHDGDIEVDSVTGENDRDQHGTVVTIQLPETRP